VWDCSSLWSGLIVVSSWNEKSFGSVPPVSCFTGSNQENYSSVCLHTGAGKTADTCKLFQAGIQFDSATRQWLVVLN
jgi:hypothetical protein